MELTAGRCDIHFEMTSTFEPAAKLALPHNTIVNG